LPERLDDLIGDDNAVRLIDAFVDSLDLKALGFARIETKGTGRPAVPSRRSSEAVPVRLPGGQPGCLAARPARAGRHCSLNYDLCILYPKNHQGFWVAKVKDPDDHFHTVIVGSYIGKNYGRIMKISNDSVEVVEIIQDGAGGYIERPLT
jgi:hypothetical protein